MEPSKSQSYFSGGLHSSTHGKYGNGEARGGDGEKEGKERNGKQRVSVKDVPLGLIKTEIGGGDSGGDIVMLYY